jgi:molybdenum cofactor cytidylyltransferase
MDRGVNSGAFSLAAVILAAGRAARLGQPKLLLPWGNTTIVGHLIHLWQGLGADPLVVVCAKQDSKLDAELDRLSFPRQCRIENPNSHLGMFSSIQRAAQWPGWNHGLTHWAIVLGDQPHILLHTLQHLVEFAKAHSTRICQPMHQGRPRHPVLIPRTVFAELARATSADLKQFLSDYQVVGCVCKDPGLDLDIDRPEDYTRALALAGLEPP